MDIKTILGGAYTPELEKAINEAVGKEFIPKEKFDDKLAVIKDLNGKLTERDKQLEELTPKAAGNDALVAEIKNLQDANKKAAEDARKSYRDKLLDIKLNEAKPISIKAVKAELDLAKVDWDDQDNIIGLDEQITALKGNDKLKLLFEQPTPPPTGTGVPQAAGTQTETITPRKIY